MFDEVILSTTLMDKVISLDQTSGESIMADLLVYFTSCGLGVAHAAVQTTKNSPYF